MADGWGRITHEAEGCEGSVGRFVLRVVCCVYRVACGVLRVACGAGAEEFVEGGEVFDTEDGVGVDSNGLDGFDLRGGKSKGWGKAAQRQDLSTLGGKLPVASQMDVSGVGNEVHLTENIFSAEPFPFGVGETRQAGDGGFKLIKAFAVVEGAHAEDAVGSLCFEGG